MTSSGYLSFPHVHGDLITFVAEDDLWLAPADGGRAWRLSAGHARPSRPRFSAGGELVAWTGTRDGTAEVYLAPAAGGPVRQLTWWGDNQTEVCGWTPDGEVLAISAAGQPFAHFSRAYAIGTQDEPAVRPLPYGQVGDLAVDSSQAVLLTGTFGRDPAYWKRYRGGTRGRLWAGGAGGGFRRLLAGVYGQFASPMLVGGRLVFLSDHEGTGNLYSCALDGSGLRRHTDHDGYYARNAATDGERVIYQCAGRLWLLPGLDAAGPEQLEVTLGSVPAGRAPRLISADDHVGSLSCDASGRASAVEVRGTVHWLAHRDGPAIALSVTPGARARLPQVLGAGGDVVWVTDADGPDALEIGSTAPAGVPDAPRRLASGQIGRVASLAAAPDGTKVAVAALDGRLLVADVTSAAVTELAASDNGEVSGLAWSPDSAWLAWSQPGSSPMSRVRIGRIADGQVSDVTDGRFADTEPAFTIDGKYLAFLSKRSFDPVYDAHFFDLSFPFGARPHLVPLAAATISPFGPQPGGRPAGEDSDSDSGAGSDAGSGSDGDGGSGEPDGAAGPGPESGKAAKDSVKPVTVEPDGMPGRVVALPVNESRYSGLRAVKGGLAWLAEPLTGTLGEGGARPGEPGPRPRLQRFDFRRQSVTGLEEDVDWFEVSGDGTRLVVRDRDTLAVIPADRKADPDSADDRVTIDGSRARFLAEPAALWQHALAEAGRIIAHDFWVPGLSGVDWSAVDEQYRPLLDQVATPSEFADVLWESLGELGTSHAYVMPAHAHSRGDDGGHSAGLLGADLERDADGSWVIRRVVPGESSDPRARSPLQAPGVQVSDGDRLLAVDGRPVGPQGPGPLLAGAADKPVELTVAAAGGRPRRFVVLPLHSERRLRYQDWVAGRRALVRELSGGRAGYLHVPDMMGGGWADYSRDLRAEMTFEMLIVDARGNSGGHTSQLVIEKLARRVVAWEMPRNMRPVSYPVDAPRGPVVALADEFAGSDGDIVTRAIRTLNLGPVVGARTWGGVIGIDGWHELADGSRITVPRYAFWMEGAGWGVENYGVDPDVEVLISPDDGAAGRDPQLETAVRLAAEALQARPAAAPPDMSAPRPGKARPALPPRGA